MQFEDAATFFGDSNLPLPEIDEEILITLEAEDMSYDRNAELINLLDLAMIFSEEHAVDDLTVELFKRLGYVKRNSRPHSKGYTSRHPGGQAFSFNRNTGTKRSPTSAQC